MGLSKNYQKASWETLLLTGRRANDGSQPDSPTIPSVIHAVLASFTHKKSCELCVECSGFTDLAG
jgi:hypothetical protein